MISTSSGRSLSSIVVARVETVGFNTIVAGSTTKKVRQTLNCTPTSARKELHIKDDSLLVLPGTITCSDLTRLVVAALTSMDGVLGLIRILPSLTSLAINTLTLDGIRPDTELLATEAHSPLATCISELALGFSRRQYSPELAAAAAILLALKTPALSRLCTRQLPHDAMQGIMDLHAKWYPHLANVDIVDTAS
ncbi:hypothetical protein H4R19_002549 [Coemansia spiralis]|nr:hypothetical protein H4R19_002549 [Coemansia spiralis]